MIIFASDLHLCRLVWKDHNKLYGDSFRALGIMADSIVKLAKEAAEDTIVVLGGDIFDSKQVDGACLKAFKDFTDTLAAASVGVHFIQGNHDLDPTDAIPGLEGAVSLNEVLLQHDGHTLYGLDWRPREELQQAIKEIPVAADIVVVHAKTKELFTFQDAADYGLDDMPEHVKHVLVGDIHEDRVMTTGRLTGVSPGPLHPTKIDQVGPYGMYYLRSGSDKWEREDIPWRMTYRFTAMEPHELDWILQELEPFQTDNAPLSPLVEIKYAHECAVQVQELVQERRNHVHFFLKPSAKGKMLTAQTLEEARLLASDLRMDTSLGSVVDKKKEADVYDFLHGLLTGDALALVEERVGEVTGGDL